MPNWCYNTLIVNGNQKDIKKFIELLGREKPNLDFNKFIKYPERYEKLDKITKEWIQKEEKREKEDKNYKINWSTKPRNGYNSGGYEWCVENWGTKWNVNESCSWSSLVDTEAVLSFATAWSPPLKIIIAMSRRFKDLEFILEYEEPCSCFTGKFVCQNGIVKEDECTEYEQDSYETDEIEIK